MVYLIDWFVMLAVAALGPIFFFTFKKRLIKKERESQEAILKATIDAEEKQKLILANNLHDEMFPKLALIVQNVDFNFIDHDNGRFKIQNINASKEIALEVMEELRSIALQLTPKVLIDLGLINALNSFVNKIRTEQYSLSIENRSEFDEKLPFSKADEINIYRATLEIIRNIQKHETFSRLKIIILNDVATFTIKFQHDGVGINDREIRNKTENSRGIGLRSIQSRIILIKGTLHYTGKPGDSQVTLSVPIVK